MPETPLRQLSSLCQLGRLLLPALLLATVLLATVLGAPAARAADAPDYAGTMCSHTNAAGVFPDWPQAGFAAVCSEVRVVSPLTKMIYLLTCPSSHPILAGVQSFDSWGDGMAMLLKRESDTYLRWTYPSRSSTWVSHSFESIRSPSPDDAYATGGTFQVEDWWVFSRPRVWSALLCATQEAINGIGRVADASPRTQIPKSSIDDFCMRPENTLTGFCQRLRLLFLDVTWPESLNPGDAGSFVTSTPFSDHEAGTAGDDSLEGGPGADFEHAGAGNDVEDGGSGNDHLWGGPGADIVLGNSGDDIEEGNDGDDSIFDTSGRDNIRAGRGNDVINVRDGDRDRVHCGKGHDVVIADESDRISRSCEDIFRPTDDAAHTGEAPPALHTSAP